MAIQRKVNPTRLLFFEGPPGGGKSSLSQLVAQQLQATGTPVIWLEEHTLNDAIFTAFIAALDARPHEAIAMLIECWRHFLDEVQATTAIYCLDGAFFHSTLKLLFAYDYHAGQIAQYQAQLFDLLTPFKPPLIHLTGDVAQIMHAVLVERGPQWATLVADGVAAYPCQQRQQLRGVEGLISFFVESQRQLDTIAATYPFAYYRSDTTTRDWLQVQQDLGQWLGIPLQQEGNQPVLNLTEYAGLYQTPAAFPPAFNHPFEVEQTPAGLRLHMVFMRNYRLVAQGADQFAIVGRPVVIEFVRDEQAKIVGAIYPFVPDHRFFCAKTV